MLNSFLGKITLYTQVLFSSQLVNIFLFTSQGAKQEKKGKKEFCAGQDPAVAFGIGYSEFPCELIELT